MRKKLIRRKALIVDSQRYKASLTAMYGDVVDLRVTIRADFGNRSFCSIRGLQNFDYHYNYGRWDDIDSIAITPRLICALIRYARRNGWQPEDLKCNFQIDISNMDAKSLLAEYNGGIVAAADSTTCDKATQIATGTPMNPSGGSGDC